MELVLSHNGHAALLEQFVVVEQTSCYGILYGYQCEQIVVLPSLCKQTFKRIAANELYLLTSKKLMGCNVVERTLDALYRYSIHFLRLLSVVDRN